MRDEVQMDLTVPKFVSYLLAWGGSVGVIWFLFEKTEDTLREGSKRSIAKWLGSFSLEEFIKNWPAQFAEIFDSIFGRRHLSLRCFAMSCLCSSFFSAIVFLIWRAEQPQIYQFYANQQGFVASAGAAILLLIFLNWLPDYISLLESRYMIGLVSTDTSMIRIVIILIADLVFTFLIWILGLYVFFALGGAYVKIFPNGPLSAMMQTLLIPVAQIPQVIQSAVFFTSEDADGLSMAGVFLYTSFFTSLWVWLCGVSGILLHMSPDFDVRLTFLREVLDIEAKPLRSMGIVSVGIITVVFIFLPFTT